MGDALQAHALGSDFVGGDLDDFMGGLSALRGGEQVLYLRLLLQMDIVRVKGGGWLFRQFLWKPLRNLLWSGSLRQRDFLNCRLRLRLLEVLAKVEILRGDQVIVLYVRAVLPGKAGLLHVAEVFLKQLHGALRLL